MWWQPDNSNKMKKRLSIFKILIITNDISSYQLGYLYKIKV